MCTVLCCHVTVLSLCVYCVRAYVRSCVKAYFYTNLSPEATPKDIIPYFFQNQV